MAEYIERGALMQFPIRRDHYDRKNGNKHFINGIESVLEYAENLPAVDAVLVVRCKDCKHHYDCGGHFCNRLGMDCPDDSDFFCSYGERKDGETDA